MSPVNARNCPPVALPLALLLLGCPEPWPGLVTCEEQDACGTTGPTSTGEALPTTGHSPINTVTGDDPTPTSTTPDASTDVDTGSTATPTDELPLIVDVVLNPDYVDANGLIDVDVAAEHADGVQMQLDTGELIALATDSPGAFTGQIEAFTGFDNDQHIVKFTPWRDDVVGAAVEADYVIALPSPGEEVAWKSGEPDFEGYVAAIAVLPDGRPVEFGTKFEMGEPRCYLRLRDKKGKVVELFPVLAPARCTAIDLTIDRASGVMHVLLERTDGDDVVLWWAGEISAWGLGPNKIGEGEPGDIALALASRPGLVAVCGARPVGTPDVFDAMAVLLRPNQEPIPRLFDYQLPGDLKEHQFTETVRDCTFANETLVLVGEAHGKHDGENVQQVRDRLVLIELDVAADTAKWTVAGLVQGVQSSASAVDVDETGRYHLAGYTCLDDCERAGEVRVYEPGGKLTWQVSIGQLGDEAVGPHDIAWSPAGYAVVAMAEWKDPFYLFKVQAFAPGVYDPLWTFYPGDDDGQQIALAAAVGAYGEVYAGGIGAANHPAFAVIGG